MKLLKLFCKGAALDLSREMIYKGNFFIKSLALVFTDFISPIFALLIYTATPGIPGWSFYEFLLFQGTFIMVFGLGHLFVIALPYDTVRAIDRGEFDKYLIRPFSPLLYLMSQSVLVEGFVEFFAGAAISGFAIYNLNINIFSFNFLCYALLIFIGFSASILAGFLGAWIKKGKPWLFFLSGLVLLVLGFSYFQPQKMADIDDSAYLSSPLWEYQQREFLTDYLPETVEAVSYTHLTLPTRG